MKIHIIGDQRSKRFDEDLVNQVNAEVEAQTKREELEKRKAELLEKSKPQTEAQNPQPTEKPRPIPLLETLANIKEEDYIWLPLPKTEYTLDHINPKLGDGIAVAKQKQHHGKNWYQAHAELHQSGLSMLRIDEFIHFLNLLRSDVVYDLAGNRISKGELRSIYDEITQNKDPVRSELLDADFKIYNQRLHLNTNHRTNNNNKLEPRTIRELEACITEDCHVDLLGSANSQGLPTKRTNSGVFHFYHPRSDNNSVAWFGAYAGGAELICNGDPDGTYAALAVRPSIKQK